MTNALKITRQPDCWLIEGDVDAMLRFRNKRPGSSANVRRLAASLESIEYKEHWYGMAKDRILSLQTWPEGRELVEACRRRLPEIPPLLSTKRRPQWRDDGDEFDRDRFDSGRDDFWRTRRRQVSTGKPVLKLTCEIGGTVEKDAEDLAWSGALAVAVTDMAEEAGYRVEVVGIHRSRKVYTNGMAVCQVIDIKAADEPVNIDRLAMGLACPAFFRWHIMKSAVLAADNVRHNYGITEECPWEMRGDLHISHCYSRWDAEYGARRMVRQINKLAGVPEPEAPWSPPPKPYVPPPVTTVTEAYKVPTKFKPPKPPKPVYNA